jgi:hypothetical protein
LHKLRKGFYRLHKNNFCGWFLPYEKCGKASFLGQFPWEWIRSRISAFLPLSSAQWQKAWTIKALGEPSGIPSGEEKAPRVPRNPSAIRINRVFFLFLFYLKEKKRKRGMTLCRRTNHCILR